MVIFENLIAVIFIILLIFALIAMKKDLNDMLKKMDGFDIPSLNRDINYSILGLCLGSFLIGGVLTMIILGF